jgi:two-component system chemotaxis response regulator CheY
MDGAEAVAKYRTVRPRVVIMDIFMPEKNGIEATRELMALDPQAIVLICSGIGYDDDLKAAMQAGARGVIYKPFVPAEITGTITQVVSGT